VLSAGWPAWCVSPMAARGCRAPRGHAGPDRHGERRRPESGLEAVDGVDEVGGPRPGGVHGSHHVTTPVAHRRLARTPRHPVSERDLAVPPGPGGRRHLRPDRPGAQLQPPRPPTRPGDRGRQRARRRDGPAAPGCKRDVVVIRAVVQQDLAAARLAVDSTPPCRCPPLSMPSTLMPVSVQRGPYMTPPWTCCAPCRPGSLNGRQGQDRSAPR